MAQTYSEDGDDMDNNSLSLRVSRYIQRSLGLSQDDHDKLKYSLDVVLGESSKLMLLFLLFYTFNTHVPLLQAMLSLFLIRINTGGLHFKTYWGCLFFSAAFFASAVLLYAYMHLTPLLMMAIGVAGFAAIAVTAPVTSPCRPDYSKEARNRFRILGSAAVALHLIGFWATKNNPYFTISVWVIFLQAIQLLFAKEMTRNEKKASI